MLPLNVPLLGVCAYSGTGKTTLLSQLIPLLKKEGIKMGLIKHAHHHFDIDHPKKDSYELRKAGATEIMIASAKRWALIHEEPEGLDDPKLEELLPRLSLDHLDLVLVEGFKHIELPKIEIHRPSLGKPYMFPELPGIIALATDQPPEEEIPIPVLDLNHKQSIADFILKKYFNSNT